MHRTQALPAQDRTTRDGIPVTSTPGPCSTKRRSSRYRSCDARSLEAKRLRLVTLDEIRDICTAEPGRKALRPLGAHPLPEYRPPERILGRTSRPASARLCRDAGTSAGASQPGRRLAGTQVRRRSGRTIGPGGRAGHVHTHHYAPGRLRDRPRSEIRNLLQLCRDRVVRITDRRLEEEPGSPLESVEEAAFWYDRRKDEHTMDRCDSSSLWTWISSRRRSFPAGEGTGGPIVIGALVARRSSRSASACG